MISYDQNEYCSAILFKQANKNVVALQTIITEGVMMRLQINEIGCIDIYRSNDYAQSWYIVKRLYDSKQS